MFEGDGKGWVRELGDKKIELDIGELVKELDNPGHGEEEPEVDKKGEYGGKGERQVVDAVLNGDDIWLLLFESHSSPTSTVNIGLPKDTFPEK